MYSTMLQYKEHCKYLISIGLCLNELNNYENFKDVFDKETFKLIINEKSKRRNKRYRTKNHFKEILKVYQEIDNDNKSIVFGTITLDNYHLNLKEDTYIRKIEKWLKKHFLIVILNKDYGSKTEREHYHFTGITLEEIELVKDNEGRAKKSKSGYDIYELKNKDYDMGFEPTLVKTNLEVNDINQTINYLLKLNNHSTKISTRNRVRIIKSKTYDILKLDTFFESKWAKRKQKQKSEL